MFQYAQAFNGDLNNWDTSSAAFMKGVFKGAESFDGDLSNWDTSKVEDLVVKMSFKDMSVGGLKACRL